MKGQKGGPMKRSEVFKNLIVDFIIFLFVLKLKSFDPYWRIFKGFSYGKFFTVGFKAQILFKVRVKIALQEVMKYCFLLNSTATYMIYGSSKVMLESMFIQMTKI